MSWVTETPTLAGLDGDAIARLSALKPMDVEKGTVLFRPGESVLGFVIVLSGRVGVYLVGPTGRDILLYHVTPGSSCIQSTLGLMAGEDYSGEAVSEAASRVVIVPREMFGHLLHESRAFRDLVFSAFAERMQSMMHTLEGVAFQKVECRLAAFLLREADEAHEIHATQSDIATAIGSAREVVSRRLEAFARQGSIEQERGLVRLRNPDRLAQLASQTLM